MDAQQIISYILANYGILTVIISIIVAGILQLVKVPIKKLTSKIQNPKVRKIVNKLFILASYGIAFGIYYAGQAWIPALFSNINIKEYAPIAASFSIVIYALLEGLITKSKANEILADGNISKDEIASIVKNSEAKKTKLIATKKSEPKSTLQEELDKLK